MANPCRHRVSLLEMKCAAGVDLTQFTLDTFPCGGKNKHASVHVCPKRDALTDEEIAQREAESSAATERALKVIQFISKEHSDLARGS